MPVTIYPKEFSDFEELQQIVRGSHTEVVQIGRGRNIGIRTHAKIDDNFTLSSGEFTTGVRLYGVPSKKDWFLGMPMATEGPATAQSRELKPGSLLIVPPGHERYSTYQGATSYAMALIADGELQEFLKPAEYEALIKLPGVNVLANDPARTTERIRQMTTLKNALADPTLSDHDIDSVRHSLLELLTGPVTEPLRYRGVHLRPTDRLVRDIDRYIIEALADGRRPDISELAKHFNMPKRTLHRVFKHRMGMPPGAFARNVMVGRVHSELLAATDSETKIAEIAARHGFDDGGRFAAFYHRRFHELPSQTLRRRLKGG